MDLSALRTGQVKLHRCCSSQSISQHKRRHYSGLYDEVWLICNNCELGRFFDSAQFPQVRPSKDLKEAIIKFNYLSFCRYRKPFNLELFDYLQLDKKPEIKKLESLFSNVEF